MRELFCDLKPTSEPPQNPPRKYTLRRSGMPARQRRPHPPARIAGTRRDHHSAIGPSRIEAASRTNTASQPDGLAGPPARSSITPAPHAPKADSPKPTVECIAMVAPLCAGSALIAMPEVSVPESAGPPRAQEKKRGAPSHRAPPALKA